MVNQIWLDIVIAVMMECNVSERKRKSGDRLHKVEYAMFQELYNCN